MNGRELVAGRYELGAILGRGGMAEVRDGWDTRLDRAVAIKLLHPTLTAQPELRRRFDDEARAAAGLSHPNIVAVHDSGEHHGVPFIVMERLPGQTLADLIAQQPLPPRRVHALLDEVLGALSVAHRAGVLHRDIKPGNILLSADGQTVKVADFGIAKTPGSAQTTTGQIVGTMAYMSPERVAGAPASVADDLYAVGVVAYEAVLGCRAFPHDNPAALARAIMDTPPAPIARRRPDVGPVLASVVDRAMARDCGQRFASAEQMRAAAAGDPAALAAGQTPAPAVARPMTRPFTTVQPPPGTVAAPSASFFVPPRPRATTLSRTGLLAAAGVVVAMVVSVLALVLGTSSPATPPADSVSTSTPVAPPTTTPPPPATTPANTPAVETPARPGDSGPGNGKGNGRGNGKGPKKNN